MRSLLNGDQLERSGVVANSAMNRERRLTGGNSYARDLGLNPLDFLTERLERQERAAWLDLCCGTGRALIEAAGLLDAQGLAGRVAITGVDLAGLFAPFPAEWRHIQLVEASLAQWEPEGRFDLITCVHGLHYIGDKLGLLSRAASWLAADGLFIGHLDPANVKPAGTASRELLKELRRQGLEYDARKHLLSIHGRREVRFPWRCAGSDDQAGPNFTGQPAVDSYYEAPATAAAPSPRGIPGRELRRRR